MRMRWGRFFPFALLLLYVFLKQALTTILSQRLN